MLGLVSISITIGMFTKTIEHEIKPEAETSAYIDSIESGSIHLCLQH